MFRKLNFLIISFVLFSCTKQNQDLNLIYNNSLIVEGESHFKNIAQLTFSGENAEAYFSPDGNKLIFQGHDGDSLCDQIYIMEIETGKVDTVSNGQGVTTCSFYQYPHGRRIIYSSTYLDDPLCLSLIHI